MSGLILPRRGLISGIIAFATAPAIVRASSLMAIKPMGAIESDLMELRRNGVQPRCSGPFLEIITGMDDAGRFVSEMIFSNAPPGRSQKHVNHTPWVRNEPAQTTSLRHKTAR